MSAYTDGRRLEYAAQSALEAEGYITVRAAGSKGAVDVLGFKQGQILMVQCKLDGYLTPGERSKVYGLAVMIGAVPLVAYWRKEGRAARIVAFDELVTPELRHAWTANHGFEQVPGQEVMF